MILIGFFVLIIIGIILILLGLFVFFAALLLGDTKQPSFFYLFFGVLTIYAACKYGPIQIILGDI